MWTKNGEWFTIHKQIMNCKKVNNSSLANKIYNLREWKLDFQEIPFRTGKRTKTGRGQRRRGGGLFLRIPVSPNSALLSHVILQQTKHIYSRKINRVTFTKEDKRAVSDVENLQKKKKKIKTNFFSSIKTFLKPSSLEVCYTCLAQNRLLSY